eukprot:3548428-Pyramimonas_sp.AAC.3
MALRDLTCKVSRYEHLRISCKPSPVTVSTSHLNDSQLNRGTHSGIILPILPGKVDDTSITSDKFDPFFVIKRMAALNVFINKVSWLEATRDSGCPV